METLLVVGLGNPGEKFAGTRHSLGREAVKAWAEGLGRWMMDEAWSAEVIEVRQRELRIWAMLPGTFMNDSGEPVRKFMQYHKLEPPALIVVHDDIELALGEIRQQQGGSAKGHNGVRSVQQRLGVDDFYRWRLGIGRPPTGEAADEFVLAKFTPAEQPAALALKRIVAEKLSQLTAPKNPGR